MSLASLEPLLAAARRGGDALPSLNCFSAETALAVVEAAEAQSSPVVVALAQGHFQNVRFRPFLKYLVALAEDSSVPVVVHLDHLRSLELVEEGLRAGATSIMYDGYGLDFAEKVAKTRKAADAAHATGIVLESELGHIGRSRAGEETELVDVAGAAEFVSATTIDVLAAAVGSTHGQLSQSQELDLELLARLADAVPSYLSLHGGSGIRSADLAQAIAIGIVKVSIFTRLAESGAAANREAAGDLATKNRAVRERYRREAEAAFVKLRSVGACAPQASD